MNDSKIKTMPTSGQMANVGFMVAGAITKTLESSNITSEQLKNFTQENANEISSRIIRDWFKLSEEKWFDEKKKNSLFWKKFFGIENVWSSVAIPAMDAKFKRIEFCPKFVTCEQIFEAYAKCFGKDKVW